jgi:hypothetical protein
VLIHVEVQTQRDPDFPQRMVGYNRRIADRYNRTVVSLAVLADDDPGWRPDQHVEELWGWSLRMGWPAVKLLDFTHRAEELERSKNPFAKVVLAHLKALETRQDPAARRGWKFRLAQGLYERGFSRKDVRQLLLVLDWLMELPPPLDQEYEHALHEYEEGRHMPYVTSFERLAMRRMIEDGLRTKFGEEALDLMPAVIQLNDAEKYLALNRTIATAATLDEVRRACAELVGPAGRRKKGGHGRRGSSKQ